MMLYSWLKNVELNILLGQRRYVPVEFINAEDHYGNVEAGQWRNKESPDALCSFAPNA